jgi:proline racemase
MRSDRVLTTIDAHAGGGVIRILTHGTPRLKGASIRERVADMRANHDLIRRQLLLEPRGHDSMTGVVLIPPVKAEADYGLIFMSVSGYSWLSGHGIIALATALIETGAFVYEGPEARINFETPVGVVQARATVDQGRVLAVRFRNVPAFRLAKDLELEVDGRIVSVDVAYGGGWYVIVEAAALGIDLKVGAIGALRRAAMIVRESIGNMLDVVHPEDGDLAGIAGTIFTGPSDNEDASMRTAVIFADGSVARSPGGTGTSALMACLASDGELSVGDTFVNENLITSVFTGRIVMSTTVGELPAVITEISGRGSVVAMTNLFVDPGDVLRDGFRLR